MFYVMGMGWVGISRVCNILCETETGEAHAGEQARLNRRGRGPTGGQPEGNRSTSLAPPFAAGRRKHASPRLRRLQSYCASINEYVSGCFGALL